MQTKSISRIILTTVTASAMTLSSLTAAAAGDGTPAGKYDSYHGLVMAGYQGWFDTPDDGAGRGWYHYKGRDGFRPGSATVDFWPDVTEYPQTYPTEFRMADGSAAHVFSSHDASTTDTHFRWMQEYGLDGAFMQRFVGEISSPSGLAHFNHVLDNAISCAEKYDRAVAIMYDLSGMRQNGQDRILDDIDAVEARHNLKDRAACPNYLWHNGRPLVAVWGVGFNDGRRYGLTEANAIVDGLKAKGYSVLLGVPAFWRELRMDTNSDPGLHALIKKCDIVMPWFVGRYNLRSFNKRFRDHVAKDDKWCRDNGVDYAPLVFPGFSWANMRGPYSTYIPRENGRFFWEQLRHAVDCGIDMIYVAMFDEIDEGTAVFKCTENPPVDSAGTRFVPVDKGLGSDYYLRLIGEASRAVKTGAKLTKMPPTEAERRMADEALAR